MEQRPAHREAGFTFAELAFGLLVFVIAAAVLINHITVNFQTTMTERDRVFAYGKAQAILSEIQSYVEEGEQSGDVDLDVLDDGIINKPTLSIAEDTAGNLIPPDHVLSGNYQRDGQWLWSRRITVQPFPGLDNRNVRYVTVRIYKRNGSGVEHAVADLSSVVNNSGSAHPTTQVFDVYFLAIENIPGWWVYMEAIRPFVESTITDLETRNPGLEVRSHWITKASYGRNEVYRPYINEALDSYQPIRDTYYYPGLMPAGNASTFYYVPDNMSARMSFDGVERNGYDADTNPWPYALADFFNHAMRLPKEKALHDLRVAAVEQREQEIQQDIQMGNPPRDPLDDMSKEPTLRLLLEDMCTDPGRYQNSLMVNLHGELLPMPPLRNYSDAAKTPSSLPGVRVVTHSEELRVHRDPASGPSTDDVVLRVYAYTADPDTYAGPRWLAASNPIVVDVMGMDLTDPTNPWYLHPDVDLRFLEGGVNGQEYRPFSPALNYFDDPSRWNSDRMFYYALFLPPIAAGEPWYTRIWLHGTPVVSPPVERSAFPGTFQGLFPNSRSRLYDLEYVPCPTEPQKDFRRDLSWVGNGPKNTARWTIRIPGNSYSKKRFVTTSGVRYKPVDDQVVSVRTRIMDYTALWPGQTGWMWPPIIRNQPENFSETYVWWADSPEDVPMTERSQFMGDPRHNPYKDLLTADLVYMPNPDFPDGYNWYFDALNNNSQDARPDFPGIDGNRLRNRWRGRIRSDIPRFMELFRNAVVNSGAVYTTLTGFSYYYVGFGNDIGYDSANGYPNSIPSELTPFGSPGSLGFINNITGSREFVRSSGANYWWGMPWLGELYPDQVYNTQWFAPDAITGDPRGNLNAGTGAGQFWREQDTSCYTGSSFLAYGTALLSSGQRTATEGCTSFFNIGSSGSTFHHVFSSGTGNLVGAGQEIADNYSFPMPTSAPISRPFGLNLSASGTVGDEWIFSPYSTNRFVARLLQTYYDHNSGNTGSGLVQLVDPTNTSGAYIVVNGIDRTVASGSSFIAKYAVLSLVHSFFEAGDLTLPHRIKQPARVEIAAPTEITELNNPASIDIQYDVSWERWDGLPYTATGAFGENENEIEYVIMYSIDGGQNWLYVQDDSPAIPGERPTSGTYIVPDASVGSETYAWATPSSQFPQGSYLVQVEAYRQNQSLHYSYHRVKIFIQR